MSQTQIDKVPLHQQQLGERKVYTRHSENILYAGLSQWDAGHYLAIAIPDEGYFIDRVKRTTNIPFFPLYPLLMGAFATLAGAPYELNVLIPIGLVLSNGFFLAALLILYRFVRDQWGDDAAENTVLFITLFPTAFFFSALYTESLFLFLSLLTWYSLEKKRWWIAALAGSLAGATRVVGIVLLPVAIWYAWQEWRSMRGGEQVSKSLAMVRSSMSSAIVSLFLYPVGLLLFSVYLWVKFQDPFAYIHTQQYWGSNGFNFIKTYANIFSVLYWRPLSLESTMAQSTLLAVLFFAACLWKVNTSMKTPYLLYSVVLFFLPFSTRMHSLARYVVVIFPLFISLALSVKNQHLRQLLLTVFIVLQVCYLMLFSRGVILF